MALTMVRKSNSEMMMKTGKWIPHLQNRAPALSEEFDLVLKVPPQPKSKASVYVCVTSGWKRIMLKTATTIITWKYLYFHKMSQTDISKLNVSDIAVYDIASDTDSRLSGTIHFVILSVVTIDIRTSDEGKKAISLIHFQGNCTLNSRIYASSEYIYRCWGDDTNNRKLRHSGMSF